MKARESLSRSLVPLALGAAASVACYAAAGATLNLPLGGVLFAAILAPTLASDQTRLNLITSVAFTLGVAAAWLALPSGWLGATLVLLSFTAAAVFATQSLIRLRIHSIAAAAIVVTIALAWLTWPVWASGFIAGKTIGWPVALHPLFAINAACRDLGMWTEQRVAYRLTNLGQDATYQLPTGALPCIAFQTALAVLFYLVARAQHRGYITATTAGEPTRGAAHAPLN